MPILKNPKHERFAQELAKGQTPEAAYAAAGFRPHRQNAHRLMTNDDIQERLAEILQRGAERAEITVERVMRELAKIGFADIRKAVRWGRSPGDKEAESANPNGLGIYPVELVPSEQIDDDTAAAVAEVSLTQTGIKVKLHDKLSALEKIGKQLGMFVDRSENVNIVRDISDEPLSDDEWEGRHGTAH